MRAVCTQRGQTRRLGPFGCPRALLEGLIVMKNSTRVGTPGDARGEPPEGRGVHRTGVAGKEGI